MSEILRLEFNAEVVTKQITEWISSYFRDIPNSPSVIGISGGKDSSVGAYAQVAARGKDKVIGVLMPQGEQSAIDYSYEVVRNLGIRYEVVNIEDMVKAVYNPVERALADLGYPMNTVTSYNTPARIRMSVLYAIAGSVGGRVINTCNLSEDWVGYSTKFGDSAGDMSPFMNLTVGEVKAVGRELGVPELLLSKKPTDGLCGKSDEDNLGFTYETLDNYIRLGICNDSAVKAKIDKMHAANLHKLEKMVHFEYGKVAI